MLPRWLGGKELVGAFGALMRDQMDLRIEARNLERFTANFGKERDVDVVFPVPVLVRPDVLVETYVEGRPINTFTTDATDAATKRRIADAGCQLVLKMVFTRAGQESEIPNFKASYLGHFPLVSADFWTSAHLSERSRSLDVFSVTRARGTLTLKRR